MENETLKQLVLAKSEAIAPDAGTTYTTKNGTILRTNDRQIGDACNQWHVSEYRGNSYVACCYGDDTTADNHVWSIAADCLDIAQPIPFFESHLHELCVALGWQGGTYHQVLAEVNRLKALEQASSESIRLVGCAQSKTHTTFASEQLGINCGEFGMVTLISETGNKGKPIHHLYCEYVRITIDHITEQQAKSEFIALGGTWHEQTDNRTESHC